MLIYLILIGLLIPTQDKGLPTEEEKKLLLEQHNKWRAEVGVEALAWSDELARSASKWANALQKDNCGFYHSKDKYGENIWKGTSGFYTVIDVVDSWAAEIKDYNYATNTCNAGKVCGHYTQIVWRSTTSVGCAQVECDGTTTWVCQYDPPGNWVGEKPY